MSGDNGASVYTDRIGSMCMYREGNSPKKTGYLRAWSTESTVDGESYPVAVVEDAKRSDIVVVPAINITFAMGEA